MSEFENNDDPETEGTSVINPQSVTHQKLAELLVSVERITFNVSQSVIVTTEDKIRLAVESYNKRAKNKTEWIAPFSLLLSVTATMVTADFKDFILSEDTWRAIFILVGVASTLWLANTLRVLRHSPSINDLINDLKSESQSDRKRS